MGPIDFTKMAKQMRDDLESHKSPQYIAEAYLKQAFHLGTEHGWWKHYEDRKHDSRDKD